MCGIAGVINKKKTVNVGEQMGLMLQGLKHRGPDSTGYAMYGTPLKKGFVMRFKISENEAEKVNATVDSPADLKNRNCLLYTSPSPRDKRQSRMPSSA